MVAGTYGTLPSSTDYDDESFRIVDVRIEGSNSPIGRDHARTKFGSNSVSTAKYTAISFIPM
jgi:hypothetical protein